MRNTERLEKQKFTCKLFDYLHLHKPWTWKKDKAKAPQRNEMLSLYCTALGFISKMKTIIPNKIYLTVGIWKTWYYKKLLGIRKESKCGDYSFLFSMWTDDDEQYFNWRWPYCFLILIAGKRTFICDYCYNR